MTPQFAFGAASCNWCDAVLTPHQSVSTKSCGARPCEQKRLAEVSRTVADQKAQAHENLRLRLAGELSGDLDEIAEDLGCARNDLMVAAVPFNAGAVVQLSDERRAGLRAHLETVAAEGFAIEDPDSLSWPTQRRAAELPEPEVADAACATCQGGCCRPGGPSWGFIGKEEVCRFRLANPEAGPDDFVAYYLGHVADETVADSCVFQAALGCVLDRTDRSTLCNTFLCRGVKRLLSDLQGDHTRPTAIIAQDRGDARNLGSWSFEDGWTRQGISETAGS
ncbi:MAG: hypothetical protein AAGD13_21575 [Pseudomonadota bacterium]